MSTNIQRSEITLIEQRTEKALNKYVPWIRTWLGNTKRQPTAENVKLWFETCYVIVPTDRFIGLCVERLQK